MSEFSFGKVIGRGMERICYANPNNPKTCFKVSRLGHDVQSRREIHYFNFLKKRNISADFLPTYYGFKKTNEFLQERLHYPLHLLLKELIIINSQMLCYHVQRFL